LALLANNGIRGGMAGRGLGAVFARIVAPSKDATEALKRFGLTANDINPGLVGMETAMRRLGSLDQETLVRMFGAENLDVSNVLASNNVAISGLIDKMNGASGAVNRFADAVASTAAGKLTALKNTVSEVKTEIGKMSVEILTAAGNLVKGTWADPNNILKGLRTLNQNMNPAGDVSAGEAANFESRIRKATGNIEPLLSEIRTRQMEIGDALNVEVDSFFPNDDAIKNLRKVWDELERVRNKAKEINDQGKAAAALQAVSTVASKIGGRFSAAMANIEERKNNSIIGPIQGKYLPGDPFEMADKTRALQEALDKSAEIQDDMVRKRKEFNDSLAIEEAKEAGKNTLAEKLQRELDLMREKSRLAKELGLSPEDAGNLAERLVTAQGKVKGRDTANTVADSLQSIGGGGRFFSGGDQSARIMSDQLAEQKKIREGIALLNERLGNGNGVIKAAFN
jgi:hypothetical protein